MKNGYKHKTGVFGTDAEWYVASLFRMVRNPNGHRRPDLVSMPGQFSQRLALEAKSGRARKGVMVEYQLHYGITGADDFKELFGEALPSPTADETLFDLSKPEASQSSPVAFYYDVVDRVDGVKSEDLDKPFSGIKLRWGDQFLVPGEYGFYAFAVARHMRTGEPMNAIVDGLRETMKRNILDEHSNYKENKGKQSWQDLHGRDALAIFRNDPSYATAQGQSRIKLIGAHYDLSNLKPVRMKGPNGSWIYVLSEKDHKDLFDQEVRKVVCSRRPVLEKITRARSQAEGKMLKKINKVRGPVGLWENGDVPAGHSLGRLKHGELKTLERLVHWLDIGEKILTASSYIPF